MEITLQQHLHHEIDQLKQTAHTALERRAIQRLEDVAICFPAFLLQLAEPWLSPAETVSPDLDMTLKHCASIHLYARILDDALDEGFPIHQRHLLLAQPMFWRAVQALGAAYPHLQAESLYLIVETVEAVQRESQDPDPAEWGRKNHHLLLLPLLLSGNSLAFQAARPGLSAFIALSQAADEWSQGVMEKAEMRGKVLNLIPDWLDEATWLPMQRHGWTTAAEQLVRAGQGLVQRLVDAAKPANDTAPPFGRTGGIHK